MIRNAPASVPGTMLCSGVLLSCTAMQAVRSLDDSACFGLLAVDAALAVFDLSQPAQHGASALALPGDRPLGPPLLGMLEQGMRAHVMPLAQCRAQAEAAIASLRWTASFLTAVGFL